MNKELVHLIENEVLNQSSKFKNCYHNQALDLKISTAWYNNYTQENTTYTAIAFFYENGYPVKSFYITKGKFSKYLEIWDTSRSASDINRCEKAWTWFDITRITVK